MKRKEPLLYLYWETGVGGGGKLDLFCGYRMGE